MIVLFNKPFNVLTQFTSELSCLTLKDFIQIPNIYPAGRLDKDSEGLLLLTDDGQLIHRLSNPFNKTYKTYVVQVENDAQDFQLISLQKGVLLKDGLTKEAQVRKIKEPDWLWERNPPIRERKNIPTSWLEISVKEGKNRQIRRMTASVGLPTLRLIRIQIGPYKLNNLKVSQFKIIKNNKI